MQLVCRTCLTKNEANLRCLFKANLSHKIEALTQIEIKKDDGLSTLVCEECFINISQSYEVRKKIINSDYVLKLLDSNNEVITIDRIDYETGAEPEVVIKTEMEDVSAEEMSDNEECSSGKCEVIDENELSDINDSNENDNTENIENDVKVSTRCSYATIKKGVVKYTECKICGRSVRTDNISKHIKTHSENETISCDVCGKTFKNAESYRSHPLMHEKMHSICEICGKQFEYKGGYLRHLRIHKKRSLSAICDVCGMAFRNKGDLSRHFRKHTGEKPYACKYCHKGFSSTYSVKTHMRKHTQNFPFVCHLCPASFNQKVSLRYHFQTKHSLTPEDIKDFFDKKDREKEQETLNLLQ